MLFAAMASVMLGGVQQLDLQAIDQLEYIKISYSANRAAFSYGAFRFDYTIGAAESEQDARAGRLTHGTTAQGFYAYDSTNGRIDILYDPHELISSTHKVGELQFSSPLNCFRALTDSQSALVDMILPDADGGGVHHAPQILPHVFFHRYWAFPLGLGNPSHTRNNLAADIDRCLRGEIELKAYEPSRSFEGRDVTFIVFKVKFGETAYWVDLERGATPLQTRGTVTETGRVFLENLDELTFEPHAGWLPQVMTSCIDGGKHVVRVVVREAVLDKPPGRSTFRLEFPEEIGLVDPSRHTTHSPRKVWSLLDLPRLQGTSDRQPAVVGYQPLPPEMPGERSRWWSGRGLGFIIAGFVGIAIMAAVVIKSYMRG